MTRHVDRGIRTFRHLLCELQNVIPSELQATSVAYPTGIGKCMRLQGAALHLQVGVRSEMWQA